MDRYTAVSALTHTCYPMRELGTWVLLSDRIVDGEVVGLISADAVVDDFGLLTEIDCPPTHCLHDRRFDLQSDADQAAYAEHFHLPMEHAVTAPEEQAEEVEEVEPVHAPVVADAKFRAIVRKLHQFELEHLRELVEEQRLQIDQQQLEIERLTRERDDADDCAEMWQRDALRAIEDSGAQPGLTIDGHLVAVQAEGGAA